MNAPILWIGMAPGENELLEGQPFVGWSGNFMRWNCRDYGLDFEAGRIINSINCKPMIKVGRKEKIAKEQFIACRERFENELKQSMARIVVPLGADAFWYLTGIKGKKNSLNAWRGYPVWPKLCQPVNAWPTQKSLKEKLSTATDVDTRTSIERVLERAKTKRVVLPPQTEVIFPTLHPAAIRYGGFKQAPYATGDIARVARYYFGRFKLAEVGEPCELGDIPKRPAMMALDIETPMGAESWKVERISFATRINGEIRSTTKLWTGEVRAWLNECIGANDFSRAQPTIRSISSRS